MPSRNVRLGGFGRPCGVRPMSRYWSLGPWPTSAARSGAQMRDQRDEHDDDERDHRRAVAAQPFPGQPRGAAALDPRLAFELGGVRYGRIGVALAQVCLDVARSRRRPPRPRSGRTSGRARGRRSWAVDSVSSSPSASGKWHATRCPGRRRPGDQLRVVGAAALLRLRAARVEPAARRRRGGRGQVAAQHDPLPARERVRVRRRARPRAARGCRGGGCARTGPRCPRSRRSCRGT